MPERYRDTRIRELIGAAEIARRTTEIAAEITRRHQGSELVMVCLLKGSLPFFVDLAREVELPVRYDHIGVASYFDSTESSGEIELTADLTEPIQGRHVLLVEDIVDTGRTVHWVLERLRQREPATLELATLLDKPSRRVVDVRIDYVGFTVPDEFVVGYGLDFWQRYRNLPFVGVLEGQTGGPDAGPEP